MYFIVYTNIKNNLLYKIGYFKFDFINLPIVLT